jgi:1,4-alpha-glucan branching enzyme
MTPTAHPTPAPIARSELDRLLHGLHHNPHELLGPHPHDGGVTVRVLKPLARSVRAELPDGSTVDFAHEHEGIWVASLPTPQVPDYRLLVAYADGVEHRQDDPYRFLPTLGEIDLHLIAEGRHEQLWTVLGAHVRDYPGAMGPVHGTSFAVWAPNARAIRLVGDFNQWDGIAHPMRSLGSTGVWELFVPDVGDGTRYKYEILGSDGARRTKADPLARATEKPPATASVVTSSSYQWDDEDWMQHRAATNPHTGPMSVYEVHLGSWRQGESYRDLAEHLVNYVKDLGFTHVELLPVMEHPYGPSWGYQVTGYYAPTSRFGSPDDFRYLVDTLHRNGIGVLLDWVPAHFPKDAFALARFDGQALYEHPDPRRGDQPDWGTHVFDFGRPQVRNFLVANALYWLEEFHIDGLRVDAVASMLYLDYSRKDGEWVPNQYGGREHLEAVQLLQETNATVYRRVPGAVMIAEESTSWPGVTRATHLGGLGFGLKWNMGWMHDSLAYMANEPVHRQYHHHQVTFSLMYAWSENFVLPISHDEVVHGKGSLLRKMPGDRWQQLANLRAFFAFMWSHPGKQLIFMGSEFGQEGEWADGRSLDWWLLDQPAHHGVHAMVKDLNRAYSSRPALWSLDHEPRGFEWIDANDAAGNTFSFLRYGEPDEDGAVPAVASITNFSGAPHHQYRLGLPHPGRWNEILNTDAESYGGSGVGNLGSVVAEEVPWHGQPYSALVTLPALGAVWLEPAERIVPPRRSDVTAEDAARAGGTSGRTGSGSVSGGTAGTTEGVLPAAGSEADASTPSTSGAGAAGSTPRSTSEKE